jgi:hypothetical protein
LGVFNTVNVYAHHYLYHMIVGLLVV